jgi:hypothetical protein
MIYGILCSKKLIQVYTNVIKIWLYKHITCFQDWLYFHLTLCKICSGSLNVMGLYIMNTFNES